MEVFPRSPIIVLGKHDDYLGMSLTPLKAVEQTEQHKTAGGEPENPNDFDYFDAMGRRLKVSDVTLVLDDSAQPASREAVRQRITQVIVSRAANLRLGQPPVDLRILDLPAEDIPFELFCWKLYAILGIEFLGEDDHVSGQSSAHKAYHKIFG